MMSNRASHLILSLIIGIGALSSIAQGQSYSIRFQPQSTNGETYVCLDQFNQPIPYAGWNLAVGIYFYTNAHYHGQELTQPISSLSTYSGYSDGNGDFSFNINTKKVGQAEYIDYACSFGGATIYGSFDHAVGYFLGYVDVPSIWKKIGGDDTGGGTGHGSTSFNRYMNPVHGAKLYNASVAYRNAHPGITHLCTNDMAR